QIVTLGGELLEDFGTGRVRASLALLATLKPHLVEQDFAELLGRADVELVTGKLVNLPLELGNALLEIGGKPDQHATIDLDAEPFHRADNRNQWPLDRFVDGQHAVAQQRRPQHAAEFEGGRHALAAEIAGLVETNLFESDPTAAGADQILELRQLAVEMTLGDIAQPMIGTPGVE